LERLEHIGTEPGHHLGAGRTGLNPGEVNDFDSGKWKGSCSHDVFLSDEQFLGRIIAQYPWD
jgi:hypothetical protein